ncbi:MAG: LysM domain-containing protein, partial [Chloroflexi bacterium]|nr:LysM domain-containing protein [Chloroflexota bacterium]
GRVFGIVDTFGGPPAPECVTRAPAQPAPQPPTPTPAPVYAAAFVEPQAAQPDGSIIHVVQTGDVLDAIAVAYGVDPGEIIQNNQLANRGRWIYPGQQLLIRAAS